MKKALPFLAAVLTACAPAAHRPDPEDWAGLKKYRAANERLAPDEDRVVFIGDSIVELWDLGASFPGRPYVNRGISRQTTPQVLLRFRQDVLDLKPAAVVILAGTNDIAGGTGPMTAAETIGNLRSMAELAWANGVKVVISSILPANDVTREGKPKGFSPVRPPERIIELNSLLKSYCSENGIPFVDLYTPLRDENGYFKEGLTSDGLHPSPEGYKTMAGILAGVLSN